MVRWATHVSIFAFIVFSGLLLAVFGVIPATAADVVVDDAEHETEQLNGMVTGEAVHSGIIVLSTDISGQEVEEFSRTVFRIEVYPNGDARWTTEHSRTLEDGEDLEHFEQFVDNFEDESEEEFESFQIRAQALTSSGSNATDREMTATDPQRSAFIETGLNDRGIMRMSFYWTNFAQVDGERILVSDVFGGGWAIDSDQWLQIIAGENLTMLTADPQADSGTADEGTVTWFGEQAFGPDRPLVEFSTADDEFNEPANGDDQDETDEPAQADADDSGTGMITVIVLLLVLLGLGIGLAWYSGVIRQSGSMGGSGEAKTGSAEAVGADPEEPVVAPEETLSDEDRVLKLLEDNGGRMKQVSIVNETDWSKSKVSMLLSDMEEDDQISKLRVGRENIISLAGQEPEAAGSPFDDE